MQRIIPIKLDDDADLRSTLESFRITQQLVSDIAFESGCHLSLPELHRLAYSRAKALGLKSQLVCSAIRSVSSEYTQRRQQHRVVGSPVQFTKHRALFLIGKAKRDACPPRKNTIRVWTVTGRKDIPYSIPDQFKSALLDVQSYDAIVIRIKKGRILATLSITVKERDLTAGPPVGVSVSNQDGIVAVNTKNKSLKIDSTTQRVMEAINRKTRRRLEQKLSAKKTAGLETRSLRRVLKRLSRKHYLRTRLFGHVASKQLLVWAGNNSTLVVEDLREQPPSKQRRHPRKLKPGFYEILRRRIDEKAACAAVQVFYVDVSSEVGRCCSCGGSGTVVKNKFIWCNLCRTTRLLSLNTATYIRNKFTVLGPWVDVNQPRSSTTGKRPRPQLTKS